MQFSAHQIFMFKRMFQFNLSDEVRDAHKLTYTKLFRTFFSSSQSIETSTCEITKMGIVHKSWKRKDSNKARWDGWKAERKNEIIMWKCNCFEWMDELKERKIGWTAFETENKWRRPTVNGVHSIQYFSAIFIIHFHWMCETTRLLFTCIRYKILSELNEKFCYFHLTGRAKLKRNENINKIN